MPSGNGNGDIQLSVGLDTKDATQQAKQLSKQIDEALQGTGTPSNSKVENANVQMKKVQREAQSLIDKMNKLSGKQVYSEDWTLLNDDITKIGMKIDTLIDKEEKFRQLGGNVNSKGFQSMEYDIEKLNAELTELYSRREQMKAQGNIFQDASASQEYAKLNNQLNSVNDKMKVAILRQREAANSAAKVTDETKNTGKEIDKNNKKLKQMPTSMSDVSKATKSVFKNILRWGFGIRSTFILVRKLRAAIKEGFTNLIDSRPTSELANQITRLKGSIATLKNAFAAAFSPIVTMALPYVQKLINMILSAVNAVGQFFAAITGHKTYTKAILQSGKAIGGSTKATKDNTKATKDNKKAKDEQLKQLASFDELNNLSAQHQEDLNDALENEADAGGGAGLANMFEEVPVDNKILEWLDKIKKAIEPIVNAFKKGFFEALGDWKSKVEDIKTNANTIKEVLLDIWNDPRVREAGANWILSTARLLGAMAGTFVNIGLTLAQALVGGIAKFLQEKKDDIKNYLVEMFDIRTEINDQITEFLIAFNRIFDVFGGQNAQQLVANVLGVFWEIYSNVSLIFLKLGRDIVTLITQPIIDNQDAIKQAFDGALGFLADITGTLEESLDNIFGHFNTVYDEHFKPLFDSIQEGLSDIVGKIAEIWNNDVQPILDVWAQEWDKLWKEHLEPLFNNLSNLFGDVADLLKTVWESIIKPNIDSMLVFIQTFVLPIIKQIGTVVMQVIGYIGDILSGFINVVRNIINLIKSIIEGDWNAVWENAKNLFVSIWEALVDIWKGLLNSMFSLLEGLANAVIGIINKVAELINGLQIEIPDWVPKIGGNTFSLNIPTLPEVSLPRLATGGVIPPSASEHLAILGDNNKETEVVSPLSTMKQAMIEALATANLGGSSGDIVIQIDGREVFRAVQTQNSQYKKQTGASAFV